MWIYHRLHQVWRCARTHGSVPTLYVANVSRPFPDWSQVLNVSLHTVCMPFPRCSYHGSLESGSMLVCLLTRCVLLTCCVLGRGVFVLYQFLTGGNVLGLLWMLFMLRSLMGGAFGL